MPRIPNLSRAAALKRRATPAKAETALPEVKADAAAPKKAAKKKAPRKS